MNILAMNRKGMVPDMLEMEILDRKEKTESTLRQLCMLPSMVCRSVWEPMHKQPVYAGASVYTNGIEEDIFKIGSCLPAGPYVTDDDVRYIVGCIKDAMC